MTNIFDSTNAKNLNSARLNHFRSQNYNLENKIILETGCGALGFFTEYLLSQNPKKIICVDGRVDNINALKLKFGNNNIIEYVVADLNNYIPQQVDFTFCVGTLYHLDNPIAFFDNLANNTNELYLSTFTHNTKQGINLIKELKGNFDQSITGTGCRPHAYWITKQLHKYFDNVIELRPPNHSEFNSINDIRMRKVYYANHLFI